jgi:UDP-N-acetylmuramoyl-L-alanyl-D-glutamate--2,6-diaminopimelate ligase
MRLAQLLADLPDVLAVAGDLQVAVTHITSDSRQVTPGALFVAYRGIGVDGHRFIPDALQRGATAIVGEQSILGPLTADLPVTFVQVIDGRAALAWLSAAWQGHPSRSMALVGITGTDGKTTTANLLFNILKAAGRRAGLISTVSAVIGDETYDTGLHTTTPDAPDVQRYLAQMRDAGTEIAVLEATSHALAQHRVTGCAFDVAVVTNITHEHLDFHGTFEAYREAKASLFRSLADSPKKPGFSNLPKTAVLNRDDSSYDFLAAIPAKRVITYGVRVWECGSMGETPGTPPHPHTPTLALTASNICRLPAGIAFDVVLAPCEGAAPWWDPQRATCDLQLTTSLVGDFNVSNILAATGAALALGIEPRAIAAGVRVTVAIPGRMEPIDRGQSFTAMVDFAHTPNALARALETARGLAAPHGRVITVFGSAGLRDREKRRLMGQVAARLADVTVITAEDPRTEDLAAIMAETAAALAAGGRTEGRDFLRVADRQRAILHAIGLARPGDVVIVCGKGHEQSMCFGAEEYPWRDQDAVRWALDRTECPPPFELPTWYEP